jgi:hypothetical protein
MEKFMEKAKVVYAFCKEHALWIAIGGVCGGLIFGKVGVVVGLLAGGGLSFVMGKINK